MQHATAMLDPRRVRAYVFAGKAHLTLVSEKTGARFTYRVKASKDKKVYFVGVLTGPSNTTHYSYLGMVKAGEFVCRPTAKSKVSMEAPSGKAWSYFTQWVLEEGLMPNTLRVHHDGCCGRCRKPLTVPESVELGLGPDCARMMGV